MEKNQKNTAGSQKPWKVKDTKEKKKKLPRGLRIALFCLLGLVLINSFHLHLGRLRYAVLVYSVFVSAFMVKAVSIMLTSGSLRIGYAGIFFWLSDFSLLFYYFYHFILYFMFYSIFSPSKK